MFIQTEPTPNPMTLKFLPGQPVLGEGTRFYTNAKSASESPLAEILFTIDGVSAIFLGADFITVTKKHDMEWTLMKTDILTTIMDHYMSGKPIILGETFKKATLAEGEEGSIIGQIKELIETRVRPAVAMDGGDIVFHSFEDGIVKLEMHGACSGCPSSTFTLKQGIENMLKHYIPEVIAVEPA